MQHNDEQTGLSVRERCQVLLVATGFVLVLGSLAWLAVTYAAPATILEEIPEYFRAGKLRGALALCVVLVFYVVGLPVGLVLSVLSILQGASGRRTRLTRWVLREASRKLPGRTPDPLGAEGELSRTDRTYMGYLPPAVGWAVLLAVLAVSLVVLLWAATHE